MQVQGIGVPMNCAVSITIPIAFGICMLFTQEIYTLIRYEDSASVERILGSIFAHCLTHRIVRMYTKQTILARGHNPR